MVSLSFQYTCDTDTSQFTEEIRLVSLKSITNKFVKKKELEVWHVQMQFMYTLLLFRVFSHKARGHEMDSPKARATGGPMKQQTKWFQSPFT